MKRYIKIKILIMVFLMLFSILSACNKTKETPTYTISFETGGGDTIQNIIAKKGAKIDFPIASGRKGYTFDGWFYDAGFLRELNPNTFTIQRDITFYARWKNNEEIPHYIILPSPEYGVFEINKNLAKYDEVIEVTITPYSGYEIVEGTARVTSDNTNVIVVLPFEKEGFQEADVRNYRFKMPAEEAVFKVDFRLKSYTLSVNETRGGRVELNKNTAVMGDEIKLQIIPYAGFTFDRLLITGRSDISFINSFEMGAYDTNITAFFKEIDNSVAYNIQTVDSLGGSVIPSLDKAPEGRYVSLDINPEEGYKVLGIYVNGILLPQGELYFSMPNKAVIISAEFALIDSSKGGSVTIIDSDFGSATTTKERFFEGEVVEIILSPLDGYIADGLITEQYKNGDFIREIKNHMTSFVMPDYDLVVKPIFIPKPYEIEVNISGQGEVKTSVDTASIGEWVEIVATPNRGYKLDALALNGNSINNGFFAMPNGGMEIVAEFSPISEGWGSEQYDISYLGENASFISYPQKAREGECVYIGINLPKGYRFIGAKYNNIDFEGRDYFIMPSHDVNITVELETLYKINIYDEENGSIFSHIEYAGAGESVELFALPKSGYTFQKATINNIEIPASLVFVMPAKDVYIEGVFSLIPQEPKYTVTIEQGEGGRLAVNSGKIATGEVVHLSVQREKGFELEKIYYLSGQDRIEIAESFIMPPRDITLYPIFTPRALYTTKLSQIYENINNPSYLKEGFKIEYTESKLDIGDFLFPMGLSKWSASVRGKLEVSYNTKFIMLEINGNLSLISQGIKYYFDTHYTLTDYYTNGNIFVVSFGSKGVEDYHLAINGIEKITDFILYTREDATKGVLSYTGNSPYVILPSTHNGRAVTLLASGAFDRFTNVKKLSLSLVKEIVGGALVKLNLLEKIDLSGIVFMADDELRECYSLTEITVGSYNTKYFTDNSGALYKRGESRPELMRYPAKKWGDSYSIIDTCTVILPYAFYKSNLKEIYINSVMTIGEYAFAKNAQLARITAKQLPSQNNNALYNINLENIFTIGSYAFWESPNITTVYLRNLLLIGDSAFTVENNNLTLTLGLSEVRGSSNSIDIKGGGEGKLVIRCLESNIDNFRKSSVWNSYGKHFTVSLSGGRFLVLFESNGGSYINCQILPSGAVPVKEAPKREGFTFAGWFLDEDFTLEYDFITLLNADTILYAKFV